MLSKVLNILIDLCLHYLVFATIFIIVGLFFFNFNDLLYPHLNVVNGVVILSNYFLELIKMMLISSLPIIFLAMLALFLSVITWNSILSIGVNIFLLISGLLFLNWIKASHLSGLWQYTPIAYLDTTKFLYLSHPSNMQPFDFLTAIYNIQKGSVVLIVWTLLLYGVTYITLDKKDVVNQ